MLVEAGTIYFSYKAIPYLAKTKKKKLNYEMTEIRKYDIEKS